MEITKIKRHGIEINVLFTGHQYIFHNSFYGILAVADRKSFQDDNCFTIHYGNRVTIGGSLGGDVCLAIAKQFIKKTESKYIERALVFDVVKEEIDLNYMLCVKAIKQK